MLEDRMKRAQSSYVGANKLKGLGQREDYKPDTPSGQLRFNPIMEESPLENNEKLALFTEFDNTWAKSTLKQDTD